MNNPDFNRSFDGDVAIIRLTRPIKRNALNDALIESIRLAFDTMPQHIRCTVIAGEGDHFCAGLDLSELQERDAGQGLMHSRSWHTALIRVERGPVPVVAALQGAVVGGGLELASACHIRVADDTTFYGLPEGSRGIFVGGGGSVRIPKLIGVARMTDMMMTGRIYNAIDGERAGFAQYLVEKNLSFNKALELAKRIAQNAPLTNYALMHALPRIAEQSSDHGFFTEAMMAGIAQSAPEAKQRVRDFLEGRADKVKNHEC